MNRYARRRLHMVIFYGCYGCLGAGAMAMCFAAIGVAIWLLAEIVRRAVAL